MPYDGSGNFNRVMRWQNDAASAIKIRADRHDQEDDNFAAGLSQVLTRDGQSQPTADLPMNGKKFTNLGAPTDPTDAATKGYADSLRSFNTAINLTGAVPEARIGFTQADIGFGARVAGTPAGHLNRFVWNDKPDLSGIDVMVLSDNGILANLAGYNFNVMSSLAMTAGFAGWLGFDKTAGTLTYSRTAASVAAGGAAAPVPVLSFDASNQATFASRVTATTTLAARAVGTANAHLFFENAVGAERCLIYANSASDLLFRVGAQANLMSLSAAGNLAVPGAVTAVGTVTSNGSFVSTSNVAILAPTGAGAAYLRPNGSGSAAGQFYVDSAGNARATSWVISGAGHFNSPGAVHLSATNANVVLRPNGAGSGAGQVVVAADGGVSTNGDIFIGSSSGSSILNFRHANGTVQAHIDYIDAFPAQRFYVGAAQTYWSSDGMWTFPGVCRKPGGGPFADSSDERIKTVVGDYESGLAEVRGLNPVIYTFKGNDTPVPPDTDLGSPEGPQPMALQTVPYPNSNHYQAAVDGTQFVGLIAQEVEAVMPGMVTSVEGYIDGEAVTDLKNLDTSNLIFAVVNAVKELADRVEQLEAA